MPAAYLALLRGVNVGGKNKLPMKDLLDVFAESGCENVKNYIQSGNVLFDAVPSVTAELPRRVAARIEERFGFRAPLVLRTAEEIAAVIAGNPFLDLGVAEDELHVYFLADLPDAAPRRSARPRPFAARSVHSAREGDLPAAPERHGAYQAHQCLLRLEAGDDEHGAELADRHQALRIDEGLK